MKTFAIDNDNNITVFASPAEAAAASTTPFDAFASEQNLAEVAAQWPTARLVATWNGLPGVTPVAKFKDRKTAISRIWKRIQSLGEPAQPQADKPEPVAAPEKRKAKSRSARMAPGSRCRLAASLHCGCRCAFDRPDRSQHSTDIAGWREEFERLWPSRRGDPGPRES
jgi:hypothetical protein